MLYCTNKSIDTPDDTVRMLIVIVHGNRRNANRYYNYIMSAARTAGAMDSLIIAPHFAIQSDISATDVLYWSSGGWKIGDESQSSVKISSYAVVDEIIKYVSDRTKFPNLRKVIVTGHSAGGQFVNRYSAGTQIEREQKSLGNSYRYIIANPSSYLYFTPDRRVSHTIDQLSIDGAINCPTYDTYKYGLKNMNAYMINTGAEKIAGQYKDRNVIYLLGDQDTNSNGSNLDESCAGDAQGANRFERGKIYYNYIGHVYGASVYAKHILAVVPGVGHSADEMYNSENGRKYLFER